jgi:hypothetical protein
VGVTASDLAQIPMSPDLGTTLARGSKFAEATGAGEVTLEHLLAALCDDPDAIAVLDASHINIERLRADITEQVLRGAQNPTATRGGLGVSQDVRRILEAAAAAARGSRRRDINGAIVLAAIVGDARSMAAEILQAHGLNFDGAIRALQTALAPAPAREVPIADDVLARARERVQSRATPSLREIMKDMPRPVPPPPIVAPEKAEKREVTAPAAVAPSAASPPPAAPPAAPAPAAPIPAQPSAASANDVTAADAEPSVPDVDVPAEAVTDEKEVSATAAATAPTSAQPPPPAAPIPAPPASPVQQGPAAEAIARRPAPTEPALPFPMPPASGYQPAPARSAQGPRLEVPGHGREFPDFTRERRATATPPPIPQSAPMHVAPPGAQARAPALQPGFPPPPPSLRIDHPGTNAPSSHPSQASKKTGERRQKSPKVEAGKLAENIPRAMRVGRTERAEIRIAKASVKALTEGLEGGGSVWHHNVTVTKAMAVRIRAPEGGFFIESASPETQWIENSLGYASDDFASWRFLITPQSRGWARLQIIVSARTVGADGVAAETALPDQVVEVKVRRNMKRALARLLGWTIAAVLGGALSTFGQTGLELAKIYAQKFIH